MSGIEFAAGFAALLAAHQVGDHWFGQTHDEALTKGGIGDNTTEGRNAAFSHALKMGAHAIAATGLIELFVGVRFNALGWICAILLTTVSHYIIDRRWTLEWVADHTGKGEFYRLGSTTVDAEGNRAFHIGTGAYAMDQAAHLLFVFISALVLGV